MDLLDRIHAQGTTVIMVTHSPECAARAPRHIHLLDGRIMDTDAMPFEQRGVPSLAAALR
jgi:putative ABC transport system ATP-binding protein